MLKICVDTSFLISFADDTRPNHSTAVDYFRHCVANGHLLCLSTLVVSEFEVGQPASDLPLQHFHIIPFNLCRVSSLLLKDGFRPDELVDPDQKTLGI